MRRCSVPHVHVPYCWPSFSPRARHTLTPAALPPRTFPPQVLATVKLLSAHAHDEHTLNEANMYLVVSTGRAGGR